MAESQVWVMMGIFATVMFSVIGVLHVMTARLIRAEIGGVQGELGGQLDGLRAEMRGGFEAVHHKIDAVESRLDAKIDSIEARLTTRIDALDKDMSAATRRLMGGSDPQ